MYTLEVEKRRRCQVRRNELPLYPTPHHWVSISLPHTVSEADGTRKEYPPPAATRSYLWVRGAGHREDSRPGHVRQGMGRVSWMCEVLRATGQVGLEGSVGVQARGVTVPQSWTRI